MNRERGTTEREREEDEEAYVKYMKLKRQILGQRSTNLFGDPYQVINSVYIRCLNKYSKFQTTCITKLFYFFKIHIVCSTC